MKKLIITIALLLPLSGITGGDIIGGSVRETQAKLKLTSSQLAKLRKSGDFQEIYEQWKRMTNRAAKEQALKHAFEKFVAPQVDPGFEAGFVDEDDFE